MKYNVLEILKNNKKNTLQIVMFTILVGIGVNMITTGFLNMFNIESENVVLIISGVIFCLLSLILYFKLSINKLNVEHKDVGFIYYNSSNREILPTRSYEISQDVSKYLQAAFAENAAIREMWNSSNINQIKIVGGKKGEHALGEISNSGMLFIEVIEYCLIEQLSLHLSSYFVNSNMDEVKEVTKKEIPDILLENRFLRLFSEDMDNRAFFVDKEKSHSPNGKIVTAYHPSGAIYKQFDLILPVGSKVSRINKNTIQIETKIFTLQIKTLFGGFSTVLPYEFEKYYMRFQNNRNDINTFQFNIEISVKFKFSALFSTKKWEYYSWADDFFNRINNYVSKDKFLEKINWNTASTILYCQRIENESTQEK